MEKHEGYQFGLEPGFKLCDLCIKLGIEEVTFYGFTQDNTKRPEIQRKAFQGIAIDAAYQLKDKDLALIIVGNTDSPIFPPELLPLTKRMVFGRGLLKTNILINYSWQWDLEKFKANGGNGDGIISRLGSSEISRIDPNAQDDIVAFDSDCIGYEFGSLGQRNPGFSRFFPVLRLYSALRLEIVQ